MKTGKSLQELAIEIQRQQEAKRDFLISANRISAFVHGNEMELGFGIKDNSEELFTGGLTQNGHQQLGSFCDIPKKYYDMMMPHPDLLTKNVNHWLLNSDSKRTVRTLDGKVRAVLSDKYRRLDNFDLAQNILPMLNDAQVEIESCEITDNKLYIKAITHKVQAEVKKGDVVSAGIIISNSETGNGSLNVKPLVYRLVCSNGAIVDDYAMRKYHAGKATDMMQIEFANDTLRAEDKAFWLTVRDLVKYTLEETTFNKIVETMRESTEKQIIMPEKAIELVSKKYSFNDFEQSNVLTHLIKGGDLTSWGLGNAVTRMAQDVKSYDRSTDLESIGYQIMQQNWN
jgi:hypothetical protein